MARITYADCFSGISGDMFLGALMDAGVPVEALREALTGLGVGGYRISVEAVTRQGISGRLARVALDNPEAEPTRHLREIEEIIGGSTLPPKVRERASAVFRTLAAAEAAVHGIGIEDVHFHEVGAVDAIVDVVGVVWGLEYLGIEDLFASSVPTGSGSVQTAHGTLPVPAPATLALLARANAPLRPSPAQTELATPTGAALLATLATFRQPELNLERVGYGFGHKQLPWPNVLRLWVGTSPSGASDGFERDVVAVVEANLDDERPFVLGATLDLLLQAGALDVFFTPIQMKKNRPAVKLTALAPPELAESLGKLIIRETSTLGVRTCRAERIKSRRRVETVATPWGSVRIKIKEFGGEERVAPEYEDCLAVARAANVPLTEVYEAALRAASGTSYIPDPKGSGQGRAG